MTSMTKRRLIALLKTFNFVALVALLGMTFVLLGQIKQQSIKNHDDTSAAVVQIRKDHDLQNKYLQCLVDLFINTKRDDVTPQQSAFCLSQVRAGSSKTTTIQPSQQNGETTTTTTTTQSSPKRSPITTNPMPMTDSPTKPNTTTSGPPDQTPSPSTVEQIINGVKGVFNNVLSTN